MKKKESLVTVSRFKRGLKALSVKIEGVEKRLDSKIDGVEKGLNQKIVRVEDKIDRLEVKIEDKAQQYHNQVLDRLDEIMVEVKASRQERTFVSAQVSDHETRLGKIEEKVFPESRNVVTA